MTSLFKNESFQAFLASLATIAIIIASSDYYFGHSFF